MRPRCVSALCVAVLVCLIGSSLAGAQETRSLRLAGHTELARLADLTSDQLGITVVYAPSQLSETVTIRSRNAITPDDLWTLFNEQLGARGFTTIASPDTGVYEVVPLREASQRVRPVEAKAPLPQPVPGYISLITSTSPLTPEDAIAIIRPLLTPQTGQTAAIPSTDRLIISDQTSRALLALEEFNRHQREVASFDVRSIDVAPHESASVVAAIEAMSEFMSAGRQGRITRGARDSSVLVIAPPEEWAHWSGLVQTVIAEDAESPEVYAVPGLGGARLRAVLQEVALAAAPEFTEFRAFENPVSGSVTVWAPREVHMLMRTIVEDLLAMPGAAPEETAVVAVHHRGASELRSQLMDVLRDETPASSFGLGGMKSEASIDSEIEATPHSPDHSPPRLRVSVDESSNSLVMTGTPAELDEARDVVAMLDTPVTQVMLEVRLVSLTESETFDLGVELTKTEIDGDTISRISSLFGLGLGPNANTLPGAGAGLTGVVFDPGDFSVLVQALSTINDGRTLSAPRVLVGNNESADFNSVLEQPVVSINASDVVATTSFGGFEPAGTTISVQPQVLAGDRLNLSYSVSLSSFVGESSSPSIPPPRQQNQLSSSVTIPDGHAIVVGGIELTTSGEAESRLPLLGEVPWLGEAFKSRSRTRNRTRFYVFIRATIHRDELLERLKYTSRRTHDELGLPDGWPELKPVILR